MSEEQVREIIRAELAKLAAELYERYRVCPATATPDSILLAVSNAVAERSKP